MQEPESQHIEHAVMKHCFGRRLQLLPCGSKCFVVKYLKSKLSFLSRDAEACAPFVCSNRGFCQNTLLLPRNNSRKGKISNTGNAAVTRSHALLLPFPFLRNLSFPPLYSASRDATATTGAFSIATCHLFRVFIHYWRSGFGLS